ncbi:MAG: hypothetical protein NT125_00605 [Candidatus Bipolaricaulota bacterium]|nr:hypothetical protein [Candidatus Bipolaricaulota bacterium]
MYRDLRGRSLAGVPRRSGGVPARPNLPPDDRASDQARLHRLRPGLVFQSLTTNALSGVDVWRTILFVAALETALLTLGAIGPLVLRWDDAARRAIETVSRPLALPIEETAFGILEVADSAMERAIRVISIERGHDPRGFSLLAFGGAGPLHAVSLARRLAIPRVIVPAAAGVLSALGLLVAEVGHDLSQGLVRPLRGADPAALDQILLNLRLRGRAELAGDGIPEEAMVFRTFADLRYLGQSHEVTVPLPCGPTDPSFVISLENAFHETHRRRYGHAAPDEPVELVALRVRATAPSQEVPVVPEGTRSRAPRESAAAWFDRNGAVETKVIHRDDLHPNASLAGPAIVLGEDATTLLPPGTVGRVDPFGSLILEIR